MLETLKTMFATVQEMVRAVDYKVFQEDNKWIRVVNYSLLRDYRLVLQAFGARNSSSIENI
jgi:hypothetical protein